MTEHWIICSGDEVRGILDGSITQLRRVVRPQPKDVQEPEEGFVNVTSDGIVCGRQRYLCAESDPENPSVDVEVVEFPVLCPFGVPGDKLWVKETWQYARQDFCSCPQGSEACPCDDWMNGTGCRSNRTSVLYRCDDDNVSRFWCPSIHMPRWASRITLDLTAVRVQRVQEASETDAIAEGIHIPVDIEGHPLLNCSSRVDSHRLWRNPETATEADYLTGYLALRWNSTHKKDTDYDANPWTWVLGIERGNHAE